MPTFFKVKNQKWLTYKPPASRDIRNVADGFWKRKDADKERAARIKILGNGNSKDRWLGNKLKAAVAGEPGSVMCCPLAARQFQIFYVGRAMKAMKGARGDKVAVTLFDPSWSLPFGQLRKLDWRKLHQQLRQRLIRHLGPTVVVTGVGELEADYDQSTWQPHYHLVIAGASKSALDDLRKKHFANLGDGTRPMVVRKLSASGWHSYASKLMAFRKVVSKTADDRPYVQRKRLDLQSRTSASGLIRKIVPSLGSLRRKNSVWVNLDSGIRLFGST